MSLVIPIDTQNLQKMNSKNIEEEVDRKLAEAIAELTAGISHIESLRQALNHPAQLQSSSTENSIYHLLSLPDIGLDEALSEEDTRFIDETLRDSDIQSILDEDVEMIQRVDNLHLPIASSTSSISKSSNSGGSFLSKIFGRKKKTSTDNSIFSIPSVSSENDVISVNSEALDTAEKIVEELEQQGPAGTVHLSAAGHVTGRRILVFSSNMTLLPEHEAGRSQDGPPIELQFHTPKPGQIHGHWTLLGNKDPDERIEGNLNDCLFTAIAAQTGTKPSKLRRETIQYLRKHLKSLAARIQELVKAEECDEIILFIGGARYNGASSNDARRIIDNSQQGRCHPGHQQGHPRGHASHPSARGGTESAENYSRGGSKTGFLSRKDQDDMAHRVLSTNRAQMAMESLNKGSTSQAVDVDASDIGGSLPRAADFNDGVIGNPKPIRRLLIVLRHHAGKAGNPEHDVFVHTFYPKI